MISPLELCCAALPSIPALIVSRDFLPGVGELNGRRWAGQQLLRNWARMAADGPLTLLMADPSTQHEVFASFVKQAGHSGPLRVLPLRDPLPLTEVGSLFVSDTSIGRWAQWRRPAGPAAFSLIGQIHTISTPAAIEQIQELVTEPLQPWDAVFCSSHAGRAVVLSLLEDREDQLLGRCGGDRVRLQANRPQLPVIPLPIPASDIAQSLPSKQRARHELGVSQDDHIVLWLGRLSMLTKQDPWPSYRILQAAAEQSSRSITLLECGQDDTPFQAAHFQELRKICPNVRFHRLGGEQPVSERVKRQALAAADLGLFLVDNFQETFGLALAEAMAAGLPLVASDWDGFRDLIRPGIDGFLVPTRLAESAAHVSFPLAWQQRIGALDFTTVAGAMAQVVQVDLNAALQNVLTLLLSPALRRCMGKAAQARALSCFDTSVVSEMYRRCFQDLQERRLAVPPAMHPPQKPPLSLDPIRAFAAYPSQVMGDGMGTARLDSFEHVPQQVQAGRHELWAMLQEVTPPQDREQLHRDLMAKHSFAVDPS